MEWILMSLAFAAFVAYILWTIFSRKGRSRQFGGEFVWSSDQHAVADARGGKQLLVVHQVKPSDPAAPLVVGLEYRETALLAVSMIPLVLTPEQARQLASDLERASTIGVV